MRHFRLVTAAALAVTFAACEPASEVQAPSLHAGNGVSAIANGGGHYNIADVFFPQFSMSTVLHGDGSASGQFHHALAFGDNHIEFHGRVTCATFDKAEGRAWIGGVITKNKSTEPSFQGGIFEEGKDIWFRVLDSGDSGEPDRTTFVGFEGGGGIITSQEYCDAAIWPDGNARTWPLTAGNITVR